MQLKPAEIRTSRQENSDSFDCFAALLGVSNQIKSECCGEWTPQRGCLVPRHEMRNGYQWINKIEVSMNQDPQANEGCKTTASSCPMIIIGVWSSYSLNSSLRLSRILRVTEPLREYLGSSLLSGHKVNLSDTECLITGHSTRCTVNAASLETSRDSCKDVFHKIVDGAPCP